MSFKAIAVITAIIGLVLGAAYLFLGQLVVGRWQIEPTEGVLLLGRRIGVLYTWVWR
jgi:Ca2+/Na+ antiporter